MCESMVDIQSATAEIRRGKKKNKLQDKNIMSVSATQGGHNNDCLEDKRESYQNCSVQCCVQQLCTMVRTQSHMSSSNR